MLKGGPKDRVGSDVFIGGGEAQRRREINRKRAGPLRKLVMLKMSDPVAAQTFLEVSQVANDLSCGLHQGRMLARKH
jgi:hypothetical protein